MGKKVDNKRAFHLRLILSIVMVAVFATASYFLISIGKVTGNAMAPTLKEGDYILTIRTGEVERGDLITFYHGNKQLVRRCIAIQGDVVTIDEGGTVFINGNELDEPYVRQIISGDSDIEYPYQVPADRYFVLSDDRSYSTDSRSQTVGSISKQQVIGKSILRIWPLGILSDQ